MVEAYGRACARIAIENDRKRRVEAVKINAIFETQDGEAIGTTDAKVKRVEWQDDGSLTVVIDYWPQPAEPMNVPEGYVLIAEKYLGKMIGLEHMDHLRMACGFSVPKHTPNTQAVEPDEERLAMESRNTEKKKGMIKITDMGLRTHYLHPDAIASVAQAELNWYGIRSYVKTFDGQTIKTHEDADEIVHRIEKGGGS